MMQESDLLPLRDSIFEGESVKIPYEYTKLLEEEYGKKSMTLTVYEKYIQLFSIHTN